ncbi:polysaccharide pyruvyl transferase family protein [Proteus mirabilis]|uniref:polysaccharide pyruvyl transferase family protein n=1 Tax=Proteus mirabilis TaxID=584 RepID=UPI0021C1BBF9|nr:polysaccharide pyruvyl transferase family protein [Proteus mirabilis]MCT9020804.1 polysaccharide pyruvyl transferase family protein [Proteus mirabilis]
MKIGILTQPLHNNYGGLLQAYALQTFLKKQGHNVLTVDFYIEDEKRIQIKKLIRNFTKKYILRRQIDPIYSLTKKDKLRISQYTSHFIAENIKKTQYISDLNEFEYLKQYQFDAYIVGSDQVWRPSYSPGMPAFFLSFLKDDDKTKRIAYAASFGVDHCNEFTENELNQYSLLSQKFHAIGVREDSAIVLCRKYLKVDAELVLDPTLLLEKDEYIQLINNDITSSPNGNMMVYVLDKNDEKSQIIDAVSKNYKLQPYTIMPNSHDDVFPSVTQWLRGFLDASFVVTDSFHGVIFSIIFNKQFIAIGNKSRGLARFLSILKLFNLENRLIFSHNDLSKIFSQPEINFPDVDNLRKELMRKSTLFIDDALNSVKHND